MLAPGIESKPELMVRSLQGMVLQLSECQPQQGRGCHLFSAGLQISSLLFPPCSKQIFPPTLSLYPGTKAPSRMGLAGIFRALRVPTSCRRC